MSTLDRSPESYFHKYTDPGWSGRVLVISVIRAYFLNNTGFSVRNPLLYRKPDFVQV